VTSHSQLNESYTKHFTYKLPFVHNTTDMSSKKMPYNSNVQGTWYSKQRS